MAIEPRHQAAVALHRFGFGPRPGSIAAIASDPRGALLAEVDRQDAGRIINSNLMASAQASRAGYEFRAERRAQQIAERQRMSEAGAMANAMEPDAPVTEASAAAPTEPVNVQQQIFFGEAKARMDAAVGAEIGFVERLVWFWSNHFCVSADAVANRVGGYEREAIRTNVLGRFADMLLAVESHPAMLLYLDNARSIGPKSVAGLNLTRGLNENLAREILELHTLGVRTVYSQADVTRFALVLTGWTIIPLAGNPEHGGDFVFNARMHEPGPQRVLDKSYAQPGIEQGRAVLADLARHPATAAHIARKLARHFTADEPPAALVERLEKRFLDTHGDLKELAKTLVEAPECWELPLTKIKRPGEWLIAGLRLVAREPNARRVAQAQALLGEPLWRPPAPQGFPDDQSAWVDGLAQRVDIANRLAERVGETADVAAMLDDALGPLASQETRDAVARAESRLQAVTLLLMAPEFQRR
jgi:uncharacterized protein (DUF1800 family)